MRRSLVPVLLVVLLTVGTAAEVGVASPQPRTVCGVCGDHLESSASQSGVPLTVTESQLTIQLRSDGSGVWTARNELTPESAERLRSNESAIGRILEHVYREESYEVVESPDPDEVRAELDGTTLVVEFTIEDMAHRGFGGVYLVDYFHAEGAERWQRTAADRMVVRGPEGSVLSNDPPDASDEDGAAVWRSDGRYERIDDETYVAFGPDRSLGTTVATTATVAADAAPFVVGGAWWMGRIPGLVFLLVAGAAVGLARSKPEWSTVDTGRIVEATTIVGVLVVALGGLVWLLPSVPGGNLLLPPAVAYLAVAGAGAYLVRSEQATLPATVASAVLAAALGGGVAALVAAFGTPPADVFGVAPMVASFVLPTVLFLPLGYAAGRGLLRAAGVALAMPLAVFVGALWLVPIGGLGAAFLVVFLIAWSVLAAAFGLPLFLLGFAMAGETDDHGPSKRLMATRADSSP